MTEFTNNLKSLRKSYNLSQRQIAESIGIKQTTYSDYERGRSDPTLEILVKLANFFRITIDVLVGYTLPIIADKEGRAFVHDYSKEANITLAQATGDVLSEFRHVASDKMAGREYKPRGKRLKEYKENRQHKD